MIVDKDLPTEIMTSFSEEIAERNTKDRFLLSTATNENSTTDEAFMGAVNSIPNFFDDLVPNGDSKKVDLVANYKQDNDRYVVETRLGTVQIKSIRFAGTVSLQYRKLPFKSSEYISLESGATISQCASASMVVGSTQHFFEMHKMNATGETHIILRNDLHKLSN